MTRKYSPPAVANAIVCYNGMSVAEKCEVENCLPSGASAQATACLEKYSDDFIPEVASVLDSFDVNIDELRGLEVEELFRELRKRLPPDKLAWAERGWNV